LILQEIFCRCLNNFCVLVCLWQKQKSYVDRMKRLYHRSYFFDQGIRFECQRCGACCTGDPGIIYIGRAELVRIAEYLSVKIPLFIEKYLFPMNDGYSIREHDDGRCFFYENGCKIYPVRPNQCKTFPFWFENLRSAKKWKRICKECPGIGCGPLYSKEQILEIPKSNMDHHATPEFFMKIKENIKSY
jgi:Fe-S-cluster containining protein